VASSFWVLPTEPSVQRNVKWLNDHGVNVDPDHVHLRLKYVATADDEELLREIEKRRPHHIVAGLGGGTQEPLGLCLRRNLSYRPAIHYIGAAIALIPGDQVRIPVWVDHARLGWLWHSASKPPKYVPLCCAARHLASTMLSHRDRLPSTVSQPVPLLAGQSPAHVMPDGIAN
jgi:N-acetylglucosaminyldiphosphoundecaprenol N-acetyl-beta-D-mannosaminyltransferase